MRKTILSNSVADTQKIGQDIGKKLKGGEIIFLSGILGAGKTELIRGVAKGLGVQTRITSPTFNIFRVYNFVFPRRNIARYVPTKGKLYHFDCYRLKKRSDLAELGWEEIITDKNSIVVLEWPECIRDKDLAGSLNKKTTSINIGMGVDNERIIKII